MWRKYHDQVGGACGLLRRRYVLTRDRTGHQWLFLCRQHPIVLRSRSRLNLAATCVLATDYQSRDRLPNLWSIVELATYPDRTTCVTNRTVLCVKNRSSTHRFLDQENSEEINRGESWMFYLFVVTYLCVKRRGCLITRLFFGVREFPHREKRNNFD